MWECGHEGSPAGPPDGVLVRNDREARRDAHGRISILQAAIESSRSSLLSGFVEHGCQVRSARISKTNSVGASGLRAASFFTSSSIFVQPFWTTSKVLIVSPLRINFKPSGWLARSGM